MIIVKNSDSIVNSEINLEIIDKLKDFLADEENGIGIIYFDEVRKSIHRLRVNKFQELKTTLFNLNKFYSKFIVSIGGLKLRGCSPLSNSEPIYIHKLGYICYRGGINDNIEYLMDTEGSYSDIISSVLEDFILSIKNIDNFTPQQIWNKFVESREFEDLGLADSHDDVLVVTFINNFNTIIYNKERGYLDKNSIWYSDSINMEEELISNGSVRLYNLLNSDVIVELDDISSDISVGELYQLIRTFPEEFTNLLMDGEHDGTLLYMPQDNDFYGVEDGENSKPLYEPTQCTECCIFYDIYELMKVVSDDGKHYYICQECVEEIHEAEAAY